MISKPVTLVLCTGASKPYGSPTSAQLRQLFLGADPDEVAELFRTDYQVDASQIAWFQDDFRKSGLRSIDRFLSHRPRSQILGTAHFERVIFCRITIPVKPGPKSFDYLRNKP